MRIVENSHATYQKLNRFYERKLKIAKKYAECMDKYMSKTHSVISGTDAKEEKGKAIGLSLKAVFFAVIAQYWRHRIHRCADKVENLANKHLDFWTGTGKVYHKQ